jgi:hypothetical protein
MQPQPKSNQTSPKSNQNSFKLGAKPRVQPANVPEKKVAGGALTNSERCMLCDEDSDGVLVQCDHCPISMHLRCIGLKTTPRDDPWRCPFCAWCDTKQQRKLGEQFHIESRVYLLKMPEKERVDVRIIATEQSPLRSRCEPINRYYTRRYLIRLPVTSP